MDEVITLYIKTAPNEPILCKRFEYYENEFTTYKEHHPAVIDVFLFNRHGDLLLQKRGRKKKRNAGKLHTTVGGHINAGEEPSFSVIHECMEELGAPAAVFPKEQFASAYERLGPHTQRMALLYEAGALFRNHVDDPVADRRTIKDRVWVYFGRYDGPIEIPDRESAGYEWMDLDTLKMEFEKTPGQFTVGLKLFVEVFEDDMRSFIGRFCPNVQ